jgi:hypothetical protein
VAVKDSDPRNALFRHQSLGDHLGDASSTCPIPFTHDRLFEVHHWWHEMARYYHEPRPFRYALGALIQAARNVTFMLQKERALFQDFGWYSDWVERASADPVLVWIHDTRTAVVHQQALEPESRLEFRCIDNPRAQERDDEEDESESLHGPVNPFRCTHEIISAAPATDHAHQYVRRWSIDSLKGRELLDACADVYDRLDELVVDAHERLGRGMAAHMKEGSGRRLPCMEDTRKHRVIRTVVKDGREAWADEPPGLHQD